MTAVAFTTVTTVLGACGVQEPETGPGGSLSPGTDGGETMVTPAPGGPLQPLAVNATWSYLVNDRGFMYEEMNVVEALEDMGGTKAGINAFRLRETMPRETQLTWYQVDGKLVMRHHEQALDPAGALKSESWFTPYRLRLDESDGHVVAGAIWETTYTENHTSRSKPLRTTTKTETWKVAGEEIVTVPAGTFKALRVSRTDQTDGSIKTFWFVAGIGKVKEVTETGHVEELLRYDIPR